jgi:hypothetical protein
MEITSSTSKKNRFHKNYISIPNDTLYELELFRDLLPLKLPNRYKHLATKLLYEGDMTTTTNRPTSIGRIKAK